MAAWLGFASIVAAAMLALFGVLRTSLPPKHQADIDGFKELLSAMRRDRDDTRRDRDEMRVLLAECRAELKALQAERGNRDAT